MAKNVRLHPSIRERLTALQADLDSDAGVTATQEDIVGALIYATTAPQLAGTLPVYKRYAASAQDAEDTPS
jgi:hypothetical protein